MIYVTEISPPRKISGLSSIIVQFDYSQYVVDSLKTIPTYYFHKKDNAWEIPISYLGRLLDNLTFLDDIQLQLLDDSFLSKKQFNLGPLTEIEKASFKMKPFEHQLEAVNFGLAQEKWLLLDSMGLGKTNTVIWLAETLKRRGLIEHCFIICGVNSLKQNWKKEIAKFSNESAIVLGEYVTRTGRTRYRSIEKRAQQLKDPIEEFFVITNIETLRDDRIIAAFKKSSNKFGAIAFDEAHKCLTGDSLISTEEGLIPIQKLVTLQNKPLVYSYNKGTEQIELKAIDGVSRTTPTEELIELTFLDEEGAEHTLHCTVSHRIYTTTRGYVKASELTAEDEILII